MAEIEGGENACVTRLLPMCAGSEGERDSHHKKMAAGAAMKFSVNEI
ncbi:hypothetical protein [Obesumbacterium proteus]|nr:hypothetical protein [Obesumbacterium proteus]